MKVDLLRIGAPGDDWPRRPMNTPPKLSYVGGATALIEWAGVRLLTDPTFDPAGTSYELQGYTLHKEIAPAISAGEIGPIDAVLLSHDHHRDNLDAAGRRLLATVPRTFTTVAGAERLGGNAVGLEVWARAEIRCGQGTVRVTATPARHGPEHADRGPVIGFALASSTAPDETIYVSGDTVWFPGIAEVARRFNPRVAILNLGAAKVSAAGDWPLTFGAAEAVEVAEAMPGALIVPLHFEGWQHFQERREDVERAFASAGLGERLRWPVAGESIEIARSTPDR